MRREHRLAFLFASALISASFGCGSDSNSPQEEDPTGGGGSGSPAGTGGSSGGSSGSSGSMQSSSGGMAGTGNMMGMNDAAAGAAGRPVTNDAGNGGGDAASAFPKRVLLYHFSTYAIASVPAQLTFLKTKLTEWGYENEDSVDPTKFTDDNLARYAAVAMINTCFEPFGAGKPDKPQSEALQRYLQKGGGLFGTHCAAVTFQSATPPALYNQLIGGRGKGTPTEQPSTCTKSADHPSTATLPASFPYQGNLDPHDYVNADSTILVKCKWSTGVENPSTWYRMEGQGRVFYSNFAKEDVDLKDATVGDKLVLPGLSWVLRR